MTNGNNYGALVEVSCCSVKKVNISQGTYLYKADVFSILPEALAAHVESVFTDQTMSV